MKNLEKIELIQKICSENNITAYEIGKNTSLSVYAIQKLLNGETKKPNNKTVDIILEFLQNSKNGTSKKRGDISSFILDDSIFENRSKIDVLVRFLKKHQLQLMEDPMFNLYIGNIKKDAIIEYESERLRKKAMGKNSKA